MSELVKGSKPVGVKVLALSRNIEYTLTSRLSPSRRYRDNGQQRESPRQKRRAGQSNAFRAAFVNSLTYHPLRRQRPTKRRRKAGDDDDDDESSSSSEDLDDDEEMASPKRRSESPAEPSGDENDAVNTQELDRGARSKARVSRHCSRIMRSH